MSFLSRPVKSQFKFHEDIEFINIVEPTELILDPTTATIKNVRLLNPTANILNLKIADIDLLKYKFNTTKFISLRVIIQSKYLLSIHLDDSIALYTSISHDFNILPNSELTFTLFTYNNGDHWNAQVTSNYKNIEITNINKILTETNLSNSSNYTYIFGTDLVRPLPGSADAATTTVSYGMTQARANTYYSSTNLNGLVTIIGNGFQSFKIPETISSKILPEDVISYDVEFTVQGANGGNNIAATNADKSYIGYGGRGAILKGIYRNVKPGQLLYLLVGQVGSCNSYVDYGGGGGGASAIFIPDKLFKSNVIFQPTSEVVRPLMIAGGGAGRYDNGYTTNYNIENGKYDIANENADINAKFTNGDFDLGLTTYGSVYSSFGGASLLAQYGAYKRSNYYTGNIALLNNPNTSITFHCGGFGGGGGSYNWGGGGGGLNGGDGNEQTLLLSGGTSWIDSTIEEFSRSLVPLDQIIGQRPPQGQIIIKLLNIRYYSYE